MEWRKEKCSCYGHCTIAVETGSHHCPFCPSCVLTQMVAIADGANLLVRVSYSLTGSPAHRGTEEQLPIASWLESVPLWRLCYAPGRRLCTSVHPIMVYHVFLYREKISAVTPTSPSKQNKNRCWKLVRIMQEKYGKEQVLQK